LKVFISSVIRGLEAERDAAERAARALDHTVLRSEDFGAVPTSAQRACRAAAREADVVVLILGQVYGTKDPRSGLAPTHEEFQEAQQTGRDVVAFVQDGVERDADQEAFVREVRGWSGGATTGRFRGADDLRDSVTTALKRLELARAVGPADPDEIGSRLDAALASDRRGRGSPMLHVAVVGAPRQVVLSPGQLDDVARQRELERDALYGETAVLQHGAETRTKLEGGALVITQEHGRVLIDTLGTLVVVTPAQRPRDERDWMPTIIDEDVRDAIALAVRYGLSTLDKLDPYERVTDLAIAAAIRELGSLGWRTRAERDRSPNSAPMNIHSAESVTARLDPLTRKRPAARQQAESIARDLTAVLRRDATR